MKYILYNNSYQRDAWYFPEDYIWGDNCRIL
jgi:hypothetical protein